MLENIIPILGSYLDGGIWLYVLVPILCLAFLATVPCIIRQIIGR